MMLATSKHVFKIKTCRNLFKNYDLLSAVSTFWFHYPKLSFFFLHTLFLVNKAQINKDNNGTMLFLSKQVSLQEINWILQKMEIGQKRIYALFAQSPSIVFQVPQFPSKPHFQRLAASVVLLPQE